MSIALVIAAIVLAASSGTLAVALRRWPDRAQRAASAALVGAAALGFSAAALALVRGPAELNAPWQVVGGAFSLRVDGLSALFLLPIFGVPAAGSIYGLGYFRQAVRGASSVRLQLWYGLATAAMALLVVAANAILFLVAWEVMALCGFLLVLTDHDRPETQQAAFVFLASAHVATLALFALFSVLGHAAGSFEFARMAQAGISPSAAVFLLMTVGFGLKAGLMPLHFWLPGAHANAPSHVSALLSGVLLKTGIYGILRVSGFFAAPPPWWGMALLAVGGVSAVLGVAFALAQHDLKRLLAYHSVENIGIIVMGIGLALLGRALGRPALMVLGFAGAALHVVNHATFKALLFCGAGAVDHACGTREIDVLGGLARAMPRTAVLFLVGAVAISGLPPLNGFVSEWLIYMGALDVLGSAGSSAVAVLVAPVLALVGGLAAACFAKVHGTVFLGSPRSDRATRGHEAPASMLVPMAALAAVCVFIGLVPSAVFPALRGAAAEWGRIPAAVAGEPARAALSSAGILSLSAAALLLLVVALLAWRGRRVRAGGESHGETWSCGYSRPTARMQYTGSSFAEMLTLRFGWVLFPRARVSPPRGPFPRGASFSSNVPDTVLDVALVPLLRAGAGAAERARRFHRGQVQGQALLVALTVLALLAWRFVWW